MKESPIIPIIPSYYDRRSMEKIKWNHNNNYTINYEAICIFCTLGFMLEKDTFYNEINVIQPSTQYSLNKKNQINEFKKQWNWHYNPKERSFNDILDEFSNIMSDIVVKKTINKKILLPISGGLDSRTLLAPVQNSPKLKLFSYEFTDGIREIFYGKSIAEEYNLPFISMKIERGYLWHKLNELVKINDCFTDFTQPRQISVVNQVKGLGDVVLLGHWGDVLFDKQCTLNTLSFDQQLDYLIGKISKPGGLELAIDLWEYWGLSNSFKNYFNNRIEKLFSKINIDHPSARIRAFKSLYWAPRWTSVNLPIFGQLGEMILPYYSNEMCKFICSIPERKLNNRKIQIEYIKKFSPKAAGISWQKYHPLNLNNYSKHEKLYYYPIRALRKIQRKILHDFDPITRNWELQYIGEKNSLNLNKNLMMHGEFKNLIPSKIINKYIDRFQKNPIRYAHSISMLLCLARFSKENIKK